MLWGWVEKIKKKFAWKNKKNLLGGSLTADLPCEGEGGTLARCLPCHLSEVYPRPLVYVMNVTQIHETHKSHIEATQKPIRKPENLYPYRKIYVNYTYNNVLSKYH